MHRRRILAATLLTLSAGIATTSAWSQAVVDVAPPIPPPAAQVEVIPASPAPNWYWVGGHWRWNGSRYVWVSGHWVEPRLGKVYVQARWVLVNGVWRFRPGYWAAVSAPAGYAVVTAPQAPPPPRVEVVPPSPGPQYFWINGHWRFEGGSYVWVPGYWEGHRQHEIWVPAHWVRQGGVWRYVGGHWQPA